MQKADNIRGREFGRWTVVSNQTARDAGRKLRYLCKCSCGKGPVWKDAWQLKSGISRSCGCLRGELRGAELKTHGLSKTPLYRIWASMITRCENDKSISYPFYGALGVKICERWRKDFAAFAKDVGPRPSPRHSLDRHPDKNGDYEPGNVRWATPKEQCRNRRSNRLVTIGEETKCFSDWADHFGINRLTAHQRTKRGWTDEEALTTPVSAIGK